jgi:hypothetical protein
MAVFARVVNILAKLSMRATSVNADSHATHAQHNIRLDVIDAVVTGPKDSDSLSALVERCNSLHSHTLVVFGDVMADVRRHALAAARTRFQADWTDHVTQLVSSVS